MQDTLYKKIPARLELPAMLIPCSKNKADAECICCGDIRLYFKSKIGTYIKPF